MRGRSKRVRFHRVRRHIEREVEPQEVDSQVQRTRGNLGENEVLPKMRFNEHQFSHLIPPFHLEMPWLRIRRRPDSRRRQACRKNTKTLPKATKEDEIRILIRIGIECELRCNEKVNRALNSVIFNVYHHVIMDKIDVHTCYLRYWFAHTSTVEC